MEIERKFLVKELPDNLHTYDNFIIEQYYLNYSPEVRIRAIDDVHINERYLTIKSDGDSSRKEVELEIDICEYEELVEMAISNMIYKTRFNIKDDEVEDRFYELDIYHSIDDLITVEVEFKTVEESENFIKPNWFGEEITYKEEFKNKNLARKRE